MKRIYTAPDNLMLEPLKEALRDHRIEFVVRNEYLQGGVGELPPNECWPEVWIIDDRRHEEATALVAAAMETQAERPPWRCSNCGEDIEGQFTDCWHCGHARPPPGGAAGPD